MVDTRKDIRSRKKIRHEKFSEFRFGPDVFIVNRPDLVQHGGVRLVYVYVYLL